MPDLTKGFKNRNRGYSSDSALEFTGERVMPGKTPDVTYLEHQHRYAFASNFVGNKVVCDVATGVGYGARLFASKGAKKVVGVDLSRDAISYAKSEYGNTKDLHFVCSDAATLPFANSCFDIVVSFETIEHLEKVESFLSEVKRILRNSGLFICSTPNKSVSPSCNGRPLNPFHVKEYYPEEFCYLLSRYFADISLYGQRDISLVRRTVARTGSSILSAIPDGEIIGNLLRRFIPKRDILVKDLRSGTKGTSDTSYSQCYAVHKFKSNPLTTPQYVIAIGKKRTEG